MATYNPPTENLVIFDSAVFHTTNSDTFNQAQADLLYLHYPVGQGTETIPDLVVGGGASVGGNLGVSGNIVLNGNDTIYSDGSQNLQLIVPAGKNVIMGQTGFPRLTVNPNYVQINGIPLSFDSTNNLGIQPSGGYTVLTLASKNAGGSVQIAVANGASVISTPLVVNSATTTISNATTINNLVSTTQALGTNNTSVATTQFVQSAIGALPSINQIPYLWGMSQNYATFTTGSGAIAFNFTSGSWGNNQYFTIRFQFEQSYILGANGTFPYNQTWAGLMDIYPSRITATNTTPAVCLLNGTINGNSAYSMTDATYAPSGRFYWTRNYSNSANLSTGSPTPVAQPISILTTSATQFIINIVPPISVNPGAWRQSATIELVQQGGLPVTTSGVSALFSGGSYYNSF